MKALYFLIISILFFSFTSLGSHLKGGEIIWECQGNGQYIFQLKMYRDCNGIPLGNPQSIHTTVPGLPNISLTLVADNDLTPPGCGFNCFSNPFTGSVEEFIFRSNPITLIGVPPASGWEFYWNQECCRNSVDNVLGSTSNIMHLRSIMYPANGLNANPCFDSSPLFAEKPTFFICVGYPFTYSPIGFDVDLDSIVYSFDYPLDDNGGVGMPLTFITPYSVTNPLPGNPNVNPITGEISFFPQGAVAGNYALVLKATSYRCGQINAEVFREIQVTLSASGCQGVINGTGNSTNHPPELYPAPFPDPITGFYTSFNDTVDPGDTVSFSLNYSDFEQHFSDSSYQSFWIDASGAQLDSGSITPYVNCTTPPCAYLTETIPAGPFTQGHTINFNWITDCAHASFINDCVQNLETYFFVFNATDDGCPAPAHNYRTVTISVRKLVIWNSGDTLFTNSLYTNLQWYLNGVAIAGATGSTYISSINGIYTLQAITPGGCNLNSNPISRITVGVNENVTTNNQLQISPNPSNNNCSVMASSLVNATLFLYDITGRALLQQPFNRQTTIDNSLLTNGIYIVEIKDRDGRKVMGKLVKE